MASATVIASEVERIARRFNTSCRMERDLRSSFLFGHIYFGEPASNSSKNSLYLDLRADLDNAVRGDAEIVRRIFSDRRQDDK